MDCQRASELTKHATNATDKARFFMFLLLILLVRCSQLPLTVSTQLSRHLRAKLAMVPPPYQ
jgi:hypothetical protein